MVRRRLKPSVQDFCDETYIHGPKLIFIAKEDRLRFYWWITIQVLTAALAAYISGQLVVNYIDSPTVTIIEEVYPKSMLLPNVTVCILEQINKTAVADIVKGTDQEVVLVANLLDALTLSAYSTSWNDVDMVRKFLIPAYRNAKGNVAKIIRKVQNLTYMAELIQRVSFRCEGMFPYLYANITTDLDFCKHFNHFIAENGPCFAPKMPFVQTFPGELGGITFEYDPPVEHTVPSKQSLTNYISSSLHVYTSPDDAIMSLDTIHISHGFYSRIHLVATERLRFPNPGCLDGRQAGGSRYRVDLRCAYNCMEGVMLKFCNCVTYDTVMTPELNNRTCAIGEALNCWLESNRPEFKEGVIQCETENCLPPCSSTEYAAYVTSTPVDEDAIPQRYENIWKKPYTLITIYFPEIRFTRIEEVETLSGEDFFSSIGGAISLCNGMSVVTFIHFVIFVCRLALAWTWNAIKHILCCLCCRRQRRSNVVGAAGNANGIAKRPNDYERRDSRHMTSVL